MSVSFADQISRTLERPCCTSPCTPLGIAEPGFCKCAADAKRIANLEAENVLLRKIIEEMDSDQKLIASAAGIEDWSADEVVNKLSTSEKRRG